MSMNTERIDWQEVNDWLIFDNGLKEIRDMVGGLKFRVAGSYRRFCDTVGDIDIVIMEPTNLKFDKGVLSNGLPYHVYRTNDEAKITGLLFIGTGSSDFNRILNGKACQMGLSRRLQGLVVRETGELITSSPNLIMKKMFGRAFTPYERSEEFKEQWDPWYRKDAKRWEKREVNDEHIKKAWKELPKWERRESDDEYMKRSWPELSPW